MLQNLIMTRKVWGCDNDNDKDKDDNMKTMNINMKMSMEMIGYNCWIEYYYYFCSYHERIIKREAHLACMWVSL